MNPLAAAVVVVPARDEAATIGEVVRELRAAGAGRVVVVDNASVDGTARVALAAGAEVVRAEVPGYGHACAAGVRAAGDAELVAFIDGDGSFDPADLARLAALVASGDAELALGARVGSGFPVCQRIGNRLVLALLHLLYDLALPDVAPLRVVRGDVLRRLEMRGSRYAWLVEMLAKAARRRARIAVLPVRYGPRRGGSSKVAGTLRGSFLAGVDFLGALARHRRW